MGLGIPAARTKKRRMEFLIEFLFWWKQRLGDLTNGENVRIWARTNPKMQSGDWTPEKIIRRYQQTKFNHIEFDNWHWIMSIWAREKKLWNPHRKTRGIYKPKGRLNPFLRFAIGGKYKWRRYRIFREYLEIGKKHSKEEADAIIAKYEKDGVEPVYQTLVDELKAWMALARKAKGKKAITARWDKYRAEKEKFSESKKPAD
jgi:hypothetical protein